MAAIDEALAVPAFAGLRRAQAPLREDIETAVLGVHGKDHWAQVAAAAADAAHLPKTFGRDTVMSEGTFEAARRAVGAGLLAVDRVMDKASGVKNAFCQIRPPGHHAERASIMGFCFFNNIAIAARYARDAYGVERVAIVDFDVHHGNGTQQIFYEDKNTFYGSTHQMPLFPGTGAVTETGVGNIVNAPLSAGDGGAHFKDAMSERILPALDSFHPDLILVSAGFDAHEGDPLAGLRLQDENFTWVTLKLMESAQKHCGGRIVSFLEGGYRLDALASSSAAHVHALMSA
jgi:acetoin utilization deacetylase AcuC-like enzyme